jgi:uncharacterized lipoprotein
MVGRAPPFVIGAAVITLIAGCTSSSKASQTTVISTPTTAATTSASPPTSPTSTSHPADGGSTFTMPNVVGKVLQSAQDEIQRVSGNPFFITSSTDATGQVDTKCWTVTGRYAARMFLRDNTSARRATSRSAW